MRKVMIVAFYELKDYLIYIKEQFESYNYTVFSYPLFRYAYDSNDKIENYKEHMDEYIKEHNPDTILWFFIDVPVDVFKFIKQNNPDIINILYNSDDPINLSKELFDKAKYCDIVLTPCHESITRYKLYSENKYVIHAPFGVDPNLFKPIDITDEIYIQEKEKFECDISIYTHNLFIDKEYYSHQYIYTLDLIKKIVEYCEINNKKIKLFGTHILNEYFHDHYYGDLSYFEKNFLYNFSKINIVSTSYSNYDGCISEHVMSILASGGLLFIDKTKNIEKYLGGGAIYMDNEKYIDQIDLILKNYQKLNNVKTDGYNLSEDYTWDIWIKNIVRLIGEITFNEEFYIMSYPELKDKNITDYLNYWKKFGIDNKDIAYNFNIPDNFDFTQYIKDHNIDIILDTNTNKMYVYFHWFMNSKKKSYFKNINNNKFIDIKDSGITIEQFFIVGNIFNKITNYITKDAGIVELGLLCKQIPYIKINDLLDIYINLTN